MNILFVYKGPKNPIVDAQANSIFTQGINVIKFPLKINNPVSYFIEYLRLLFFLVTNKVDIIHAHYSYSGIISGLTFKKTICSLMGSDVFNQNRLMLNITYLFHRYIWKTTIVKSKTMQKTFKRSIVIPNGVDLFTFKPLERTDVIEKTVLKQNKKNIIFIAEKIHRNSKNFQLAQSIYNNYLNKSDIELNLVTNKTQKDLLFYYNAADVFLLTSLSEGSPNTIKEAMACNCPIVTTNVGDVKKVLGDTKGCYVTSYSPDNIAEKLKNALEFCGRTNGRDRIKTIKLDSQSIAERIINIYKIQIKD